MMTVNVALSGNARSACGGRTQPRKSVMWGKLALASACLLLTPVSAYARDMGRIYQQGRWFVDESNRVIQIRGGNVYLPAFDGSSSSPHAPSPGWTGNTPARMAEQGFNGIRLAIFLAELMPEPGKIDEAYLERIAKTIAAYKQAGVRTLIDFHQDEYSAAIGTRGLPAWAVFADGAQRDATLNFPMRYFQDPGVQHAFDNFWANHPVPGTGKGVQDLYVEALAAVARRFRNEPAVLGIDVMNEPFPGSRCASPDPVKADCPELEQQLLKPFYQKAARAINDAAPKILVFTEPFMLQGALGTPIRTPVAGNAGRRGLSFHNYGPVKAVRDRVNDYVVSHATTAGAAILNTEWGYSNDPEAITGQADDFDTRFIPWLAWPRGAFEAIVDEGLPDRGNGNRLALLRAYARPYPEAVAGTPTSLGFDGASGTFTLRYSPRLPDGRRAAATLATEIRLPKVQFPHGYKVDVIGGRLISQPGASVVRIRAMASATDIVVRIKRSGELAPLTPSHAEAEGKAVNLPPRPSGPLSRRSLLGHIVQAPGGREILESEVPGMLAGLGHLQGWQAMTLESIRKFAPAALDETRLARIDGRLAGLGSAPQLGIDSLTSDLLADPRTRAILEREVPKLIASPQQSLFPQTRLRDLKAVMPDILTDETLRRLERAFASLGG